MMSLPEQFYTQERLNEYRSKRNEHAERLILLENEYAMWLQCEDSPKKSFRLQSIGRGINELKRSIVAHNSMIKDLANCPWLS